jgi:phage terminase small subunit
MLTPKQTRFAQEYLFDLNAKQAAIRAGYSPKTAEVQGSRLLGHPNVQAAVDAAMQARSRRAEVTADRVVTELAKIAFADMRDYWPRAGETIDLHRLDQDRTAAIEEITIDEAVDPAGVLHRRTRLKLHDKLAALTNLARHLGMFVDRQIPENSIEHRVMMMTPEERVEMAQQILEKGRKYLPAYEEWERKRSREATLRATAERGDGDG